MFRPSLPCPIMNPPLHEPAALNGDQINDGAELDFPAFGARIKSFRKLFPLIYGGSELQEKLEDFNATLRSFAPATATLMAALCSPPEEVSLMAESHGIPLADFRALMTESPYLPRK